MCKRCRIAKYFQCSRECFVRLGDAAINSINGQYSPSAVQKVRYGVYRGETSVGTPEHRPCLFCEKPSGIART